MPWGELANDLERPVFQKYLLLPAIKGWLLDRPEVAGALMTGSGAAMFAVLREGADAGGLAGALRGEFGPALWTWTGLVDGTSAAA
jgi:4-diphosphocytidyl-2-C-methyl-D-erythritol kinase